MFTLCIILQIIFNVNKKRDVTQSLQIEWFQTSVFNYRKNLFSFGIMLNRLNRLNRMVLNQVMLDGLHANPFGIMLNKMVLNHI